ncbi:MAG: UDP-galactopyranose mutase [Selenomonadaceae bacterium]|nr:UDP-galactopyranose mutase [Selenomonadaceae bacterium]
MFFDTLIIGAGFSGAVLAERLAAAGKKVLVVERRRTIGGNCYDRRDENGILVHAYGPHLFHTDDEGVWQYLSRFTRWDPYQHHVRAVINGKAVPLPFSLDTLHEVFPASLADRMEEKLLAHFDYDTKVPILELKKVDDKDLGQLADFIYENIFLHYTEKQWDKKPEEIDGAVTARVPVYIGRDQRYFQDRFQGVPSAGYTKLFEQMLRQKNIKLMLNTSADEVLALKDGHIEVFGQPFEGDVIYTGMVDELFGFGHGELPYRSVRMDFQTMPGTYHQAAATVNYPNNYDFTRITEFRQIHPCESATTTILREYPQPYVRGENTAYYPIFTDEAKAAYAQYAEAAKAYPRLHLVGRLAEYRYYDMDDAVRRALDLAQELADWETGA